MKKVTIYTKSNCSACLSAKSFLHSQNVDFKEIHIDNNPEAMKVLIADQAITVPYIKIGKEKIIGFNTKSILNALK